MHPHRPATPRLSLAAAFLVALLIVAAQMAARPMVQPAADALDYLTHAVALHKSGTYPLPSTFVTDADSAAAVEPGRKLAPLYPAFLAGLMSLDDQFARVADCTVGDGNNRLSATACEAESTLDWGILFPAQAMLAAGALTLVWWMAWTLSGRRDTAWLAMVLAAASGIYGAYAHQILTESLVIPLGTLLMVLLAATAWQKRLRTVLLLTLAAGFVAGLAALVRPTFTYILVPIALGSLLLALRPAWRRSAGVAGLALIAGYLIAAGPWMLRNLALFGDVALTSGYGGIILTQRVAYNAMSLQEWFAAFIYWLPDFGDSLGRSLFGAEAVQRLDWFAPNSYYVLGQGQWLDEFTAQAGGLQELAGWLIREKVLPDLHTHLAVTLPMISRGLWVSGYYGLIGSIALFWALGRGVRRKEVDWLLFCLPALALVVLHAGISPSIPRYNLLLVPCIAVALAPLLIHWGRRLGSRFAGRSGSAPTRAGES